MVKKSKKTRGSKKGKGDFFRTGMDADDLRKELKKSGGSSDPDLLFLYDGDQVQLTVVNDPKEWGTYRQHYLGRQVGYRLCSGEGCQYCDDGDRASQRTMIGVYVHSLYQAGRGDYKARRIKDMGYKFFPMNKETTEGLLRRAARRGGKLNDRILIVERQGEGTDTKYDVERTEESPKKRIVRGWDMDVSKKLRSMMRKESEEGNEKKKGSSRDEDYDYDDDAPLRRKKSKKSSKRRRQ